jgi:hypothetical protein
VIYGGSIRDRAPDEPYTRWFSARTRRSTTRSLGSTGARLSCAFLVQLMVQAIKRKLQAIGNAKLVIDLA